MTSMLFREINPDSPFFNRYISKSIKERCLRLSCLLDKRIKIIYNGLVPIQFKEWYGWLLENNGGIIANNYALCFLDMQTKVMFLLKFQREYFD
jgi:hypothetical protein